MMFYDGSLFPEWQGNLFVGGLASTKLVRLQLQDGKVIGEEWLLQDRGRRIRDVKQGRMGRSTSSPKRLTVSFSRSQWQEQAAREQSVQTRLPTSSAFYILNGISPWSSISWTPPCAANRCPSSWSDGRCCSPDCSHSFGHKGPAGNREEAPFHLRVLYLDSTAKM